MNQAECSMKLDCFGVPQSTMEWKFPILEIRSDWSERIQRWWKFAKFSVFSGEVKLNYTKYIRLRTGCRRLTQTSYTWGGGGGGTSNLRRREFAFGNGKKLIGNEKESPLRHSSCNHKTNSIDAAFYMLLPQSADWKVSWSEKVNIIHPNQNWMIDFPFSPAAFSCYVQGRKKFAQSN